MTIQNTSTTFKVVQTNKQGLNNTDITNGAVYFVSDTKQLCFDYGSTRTFIEDIVILTNDNDRESILFTPLNKFYFCLDTTKLYLYKDGTWYQVNGGEDLSGYLQSTDLDGNTIHINSSDKVEVTGIKNQNGNGTLKYWSGTRQQYDLILNKDNNTIYYITDETGVSAMTGADGTNAGTSGLVPQPLATDNTKFLKGDGTWSTVDSLPSQTSQSGKFLTTNGTTASWGTPTDTQNTTGGDDTSAKIYLTGMTSQTTSNGNARTYTHDTVFVDTSGRLNSNAPANDANDTTVATTKWVKDQGYTSNVGTVTSVNNVSPTNGNVSITIPTITDTYDGTSTNGMSGVAVKSAIDTAISSVYKPSGSIAFADRPTLAKGVLGNVYNISESFTTTSDFVEGADKSYPAGTNIVVINTGSDASPTYKFDVLSGIVDLSGYQQTSTAVTHTANTGVGSATQPVYIANNGTATATTYSLAKSVPADAVFTDTTYSTFSGADGTDAGTSGLVPQPSATDNTKYLKGDGTWSTIPSPTVDQTFDGTSTNAQSGVAIDTKLNDYVTIDTNQNITGEKTFVGQKKIKFKQSGSNDKLGFTLYTNNDVEKGYLEYNPTNKIDNIPLMTLGNYATATNGLSHIGFRRYSGITGEDGTYNLLVPLISDAKTPFSLTMTYTNFYLPLGFTNGTTTVLTAKSGLVNLSSLIPTYTVFTGADGTNAGTSGLVKQPSATDNTKFLKGDGTWAEVSTTDTKNTAGSTDTSSKLFLIGATSQADNPQTYSQDTAFVDTSGQLNSANPSASTNSTVVATTKWVTDKGYTTNTGTITGINMNGASKGTSGVVDLGTVLTSHQTIKQDGITGATVNRFCSCTTSASTAQKDASITNGTFSLETGASVRVKFTNANTANNPTLKVGTTTAKNIFHNGSQITTGTNKALLAGVCDFVYDGTQYHLVGNYIDTDTIVTSLDWSAINNKPSSFTPASHNQASNTINAMTGYSKASSVASISTSDSLNTAIGKLEKGVEEKATVIIRTWS